VPAQEVAFVVDLDDVARDDVVAHQAADRTALETAQHRIERHDLSARGGSASFQLEQRRRLRR
jgi:hypothetical protein